jgi:hypothetical protein
MNKLEQLAQLLKLIDCGETVSSCNSLLKVGQAYLIRTVTMAYTGKIEEIGEHEIRLSNACWIASTGRFASAAAGVFDANSELEPFTKDAIIGRGGFIDATPLFCELPNKQK